MARVRALYSIRYYDSNGVIQEAEPGASFSIDQKSAEAFAANGSGQIIDDIPPAVDPGATAAAEQAEADRLAAEQAAKPRGRKAKSDEKPAESSTASEAPEVGAASDHRDLL